MPSSVFAIGSRIFPVLENKVCNHRYIYWIFSFFAVLPPPLWESRRRVWKIADNASNILDVGCGYAHMTRSSKGKNVFALDLDRNAMRIAKTYGKNNFFPVHGSAVNLPFREGVFDAVVGTEIIEHLTNPDSFVKDVHRVLVSKGVLLLSTPNGEVITTVHKDHVCHYTEHRLCRLLSHYFRIKCVEKRFDTSFLMTCRLTSLRTRRRANQSDGTIQEYARTNKMFILIVPILIAMSPIVNLIQKMEGTSKKGKCNLVVECTKI